MAHTSHQTNRAPMLILLSTYDDMQFAGNSPELIEPDFDDAAYDIAIAARGYLCDESARAGDSHLVAEVA